MNEKLRELIQEWRSLAAAARNILAQHPAFGDGMKMQATTYDQCAKDLEELLDKAGEAKYGRLT